MKKRPRKRHRVKAGKAPRESGKDTAGKIRLLKTDSHVTLENEDAGRNGKIRREQKATKCDCLREEEQAKGEETDRDG